MKRGQDEERDSESESVLPRLHHDEKCQCLNPKSQDYYVKTGWAVQPKKNFGWING